MEHIGDIGQEKEVMWQNMANIMSQDRAERPQTRHRTEDVIKAIFEVLYSDRLDRLC